MFPGKTASGAVAAAVSAAGLLTLRIIDLRSLLQHERASAFTLLELLIVVGIIAVLLVLLAPAFTTIKSGSDFRSGVYGIQGLLENARTYAKANHT